MSTVQSVHRAVAVMRALEWSTEPLSAASLAEKVGLDRTIVHRLLQTLLIEGLVERVPTGEYRLGAMSVAFANAHIDSVGVRTAAFPYIRELHRAYGGDACSWGLYLMIPVRDQVVTIDRVWGSLPPLDTVMGLGTSYPLDRTAAGRAMLAYVAPETAEEWIGADRLELIGDTLEIVRQQGGIDFNAFDEMPGISGIGCAIRDGRGRPVASLAVSGPELETELHPASVTATRLSRTCKSISAALP